jgi:hypothetical protein
MKKNTKKVAAPKVETDTFDKLILIVQEFGEKSIEMRDEVARLVKLGHPGKRIVAALKGNAFAQQTIWNWINQAKPDWKKNPNQVAAAIAREQKKRAAKTAERKAAKGNTPPRVPTPYESAQLAMLAELDAKLTANKLSECTTAAERLSVFIKSIGELANADHARLGETLGVESKPEPMVGGPTNAELERIEQQVASDAKSNGKRKEKRETAKV